VPFLRPKAFDAAAFHVFGAFSRPVAWRRDAFLPRRDVPDAGHLRAQLASSSSETPMDERAFFNESQTTKPSPLICQWCRTENTYDLRWVVRKKKDRLPGGADERDRAKFAKLQNYMVLMDDKVQCKRCRRSFDVSGIKTLAFL
jgi:hypothetical protein